MIRPLQLILVAMAIAVTMPALQARQPAAIEAETIQHFQALLRLDTSSPPGNETRAVE